MQLAQKVKQFFEVNSSAYGLNPSSTRVEPILNWGGFVNSSFFVGDDRKHFHLKVCSEDSTELKQFFKASSILHGNYHAPKAHSWIDIPETKFSGILFDFIHGRTADCFSDSQIQELGELLSKMQQDSELKCLLGDEQVRCSQTYLDVYDDRFLEDLKPIGQSLPPFVSQDTFDFMKDEATKLRERVQKIAEFQVFTSTPIHSDIWANNLMIAETGDWFLIDWDGLKIGDPSLDYAMLLGPAKNSWSRRGDPSDFGLSLPADARARIPHYHQAMLLDWVIDPLADWIEASQHLEWRDKVRAENEKNHLAALQCYRSLYT